MARFSRLLHPAALMLGTSLFGGFSGDLLFGRIVAHESSVVSAAKSGCQAIADECRNAWEDQILATTVTEGITVQLPTFAFKTVTSAVSLDTIGAWHAEAAGLEASRHLLKFAAPVPMTMSHVGVDGLIRIGVDFDIARPEGKPFCQIITPRIIITEEEEDRLLGTATTAEPVGPQTLPALIMAHGAAGARKFFGIQSTPAEIAAATARYSTAACHQGLLDMPFSLDKVLTLEVEITPLQEAGIVAKEQPVLRMSAQTQERMMRHFAQAAEVPHDAFATGVAPEDDQEAKIGPDYEFPDVKSWAQLRASRTDAPATNPGPDMGIEPVSEDFVQHLPPRDDVPLENPPAIAASRVVSPTMSPLEYAETFLTQDERNNLPLGTELLLSDHHALTGRMVGIGGLATENMIIQINKHSDSKQATIYFPDLIEEEPDFVAKHFERTLADSNMATRDPFHDYNVMPTAHDESIATSASVKHFNSPPLSAMGGLVRLTPCDSGICEGFRLQIGPFTAKAEPVAEAQAFDGPAQITLHDTPHAPGQGFVWPAQPAGTSTQPAPQESLDDLADRLEREFLQRAVSGQLQVPAEISACPAVDKDAACKAAAACQSGQCQSASCPSGQCLSGQCPADACPTASCPPGPDASHGCPGIASDSPCCNTGLPSPTTPSVHARSQWSLPTPAVTFNPYAHSTPLVGPGAGMVLPRDCDFYMNGGREVPAGPPTCGPQGCPGPATFASPYPPGSMTHPQIAYGPQPPRMEWTPAMNAPAQSSSSAQCQNAAPGNRRIPATAASRTPISGEVLETYRDISRTLGQMAERCEAQGLYEQADELRDMAQEYRMSARVVHGHLSAMPLPQPAYGPMSQPVYGQLPQHMLPYAVPSMYMPDQAPSLAPPVAPATYPQPQPQPLPIAQPMLMPRY